MSEEAAQVHHVIPKRCDESQCSDDKVLGGHFHAIAMIVNPHPPKANRRLSEGTTIKCPKRIPFLDMANREPIRLRAPEGALVRREKWALERQALLDDER